MRKLLFFILVSFFLFNQIHAQIAIGSGNLETENAPFEPYYSYSYTQTVYLSSEINGSGSITDIQWFYSGVSALPNSQDLVIYMAESTREEYGSTTDWEPIDSFTQVYSGGIVVSAGEPGWVQIILDTPFAYSGVNNLIIAVEENMPGSDNSSDDFYNSQVITNRTISHFSDGANADPTNPPTASNIDDTVPNIILGGISQLCPNPNNLQAVVNVSSATLSWDGGTASSWEVINQEEEGTIPLPSDSGVYTDVNSYQVSDLTEGLQYEFYVRADCGENGFSGWVGPFVYYVNEEGEVCSNPITVGTLPYSVTDNTSNYLDEYSGSPGENCWNTTNYLDGDDVVYAYTPNEDTNINFELSNISANYAGVFVYTDCDSIGESCVTGAVNVNSTSSLMINDFEVFAGITYYIVISSALPTQSIGYTLEITENTCVVPEVSFEVVSDCVNGSQFNIEVDITDMGTGTSYTITDNQGGTSQTATTTGIVTMGPYENVTEVVVSVENTNDSSCIVLSEFLTQDVCPDNYVDCSEGPLNSVFCYGPNNETIITFTSNDGSPLTMNINAGLVELNWDYFYVYDTDGTELTPEGGLTGLLSGYYQSSGDTISYWVESDGAGSCSDPWTNYASIDVTVTCATCEFPEWSYEVVSDCANGPQFNIEVDVTNMGSATSYTITDNFGIATQSVTTAGIVTIGPYTNNTEIELTIVNDEDDYCTLTGAMVTQEFCLDTYVDCAAEGPINFMYCYENNDTNVFTFTSSDGTALNFDVNSGEISIYGDYFHVYDTDGTELTPEGFYGVDYDGNLAGLSYQSSGDTISFWIESNIYISCADASSDFEPLDVTVSCATCINPQAEYTVVNDCENGDQFLVDVEIINMGSATTLTISSDYDSNTISATTLGTYQMGPFPFLTEIEIAVVNADDVSCDIYSPVFYQIACPPENDNPCGAVMVEVNTVDSCELFASGTIAGATPSVVDGGACEGVPNDDVWFEFTAISDSQIITLFHITNGNVNLDYSVFEGNCDGTLTELFCTEDTINAVDNLVVGETYLVRVYSNEFTNTATTFDVCIKPTPGNVITDVETYTVEELVLNVLVNNPCAQISNISYSTGSNFDDVNGIAYFSTESSGFPFDEGILLASGNASLVDGPNSPVIATTGYYGWPGDEELDEIVGGTTYNASIIEFDFVPLSNAISFDFLMASEEYNGTFYECDYSDAFAFLLTDESGVTTNLAVLPGTDTPILVTNIHPDNDTCDAINEQYFGGYTPNNLPPIKYDGRTVEFTAYSEVVIGDTYHIKLIMADEGDTALDSAVFLKAGSLDIGELDLGEDYSIENGNALCMGEPIILNTGASASVEHVWYKDGFPIEGETGPTLVVNETGEYTAQVIFSPTCIVQDSVSIEYYSNPDIMEPVDLEQCSTISTAIFDLSENDDVILGGLDPSMYTVSYYLTEQDAIEGANPVNSPYSNISNPQTIWVSVVDTMTGCKSYASFELNISEPSHTASSVDLLECDNDEDGVVEYNLDAHSSYVLDGQDAADYIVSYYSSEQDAVEGINPLSSPYTSAGNETVWVRVEILGLPNCYVINSFALLIGTSPETTFTQDFDYEVCPNATVPIIIEATPENYDEAEVTINWYQDGGLVEGENGLTLPVLMEGNYEIEVIFNDTGCSAVTEQFVVELDNCIIPEGISPNGDGMNDYFDLSNFRVSRIEIFNRYGTLVYSKNNYTNEWYGQTNNGDELPVGTYFYTMEYENGKKRSAWVYINK